MKQEAVVIKFKIWQGVYEHTTLSNSPAAACPSFFRYLICDGPKVMFFLATIVFPKERPSIVPACRRWPPGEEESISTPMHVCSCKTPMNTCSGRLLLHRPSLSRWTNWTTPSPSIRAARIIKCVHSMYTACRLWV